jgi:hypothetical protein
MPPILKVTKSHQKQKTSYIYWWVLVILCFGGYSYFRNLLINSKFYRQPEANCQLRKTETDPYRQTDLYALNRLATSSQLITLKNASMYSGRRFWYFR